MKKVNFFRYFAFLRKVQTQAEPLCACDLWPLMAKSKRASFRSFSLTRTLRLSESRVLLASSLPSVSSVGRRPMLAISLVAVFLAVASAAKAYHITLGNTTHGTVVASHTDAAAGQIVTLLATPDNDFTFFYKILANSQVTVKQPTGIIFNGEGTTFDGWIKGGNSPELWTITENTFATSYQPSMLEQTNSLTDLGFSEAQLDASPTFTATVDMWVYQLGAAIASATVTMLDENGNTLGTVTIADDTQAHDWQTYTKSFTLIAGTRQLKYTLQGQSLVYWSGPYGPRFRNLDIRTDLPPANKSATTHSLRFLMPTEDITIQTFFEPTDPDAPVDDNLLVWTSYRRHFNGKGTTDDPYTIENAAQLAQLAYDVRNGNNYSGKIFVQTADIDLNKTVNGQRVQWVPIGGFKNTTLTIFNGHFFGHQLWGDNATNRRWAVKNLYVNYERTGKDFEYTLCGLFGYAKGVLRDITLTDADICWKGSSGPSIGLLCARYDAYSDEGLYTPAIWGCSAQGQINLQSSMARVGGIVGMMNGKGTTAIEHCKADVTIHDAGSTHLIGGVAGHITNTSVSDCTARVNLSCDSSSTRGGYGGIVGYAQYKASDYIPCNVINACAVSGNLCLPSTGSGTDNHLVGGIVGDAEKTLVSSCVSMVDMEGNGLIGGIIARLDANDNEYAAAEHNIFAGHIDGTSATKAAGIVTSMQWCFQQHISNNIMTGTITMGNNAANCYAITASLLDDDTADADPLTVVANCYYDTILCAAQALPPTQRTHPTVKGCATSTLTSGKETDLPFLMSDDDLNGFVFNNGYYPRIVETRHWLRLAYNEDESAYNARVNQFDTSLAAKLGGDGMKYMWKDTSTDDGTVRPTLYTTAAWLASLTVNITEGDYAFDFVSTASARQVTGSINQREFNALTQEYEDKEVRTLNTVAIPKDAECIKVNGLSATAVKQGDFNITLSAATFERPFHFDITSLGKPWDGTVATVFQTGDGTELNPFIIRNPQQLAYAVNNNQPGCFYRQICDLWLNNSLLNPQFLHVEAMFEPPTAGTLWLKNTQWNGHYDGTGHCVRGLYAYVWQDDSNCNYGLFGSVNANATVENLAVTDALIQAQLPGNSSTCQGQNTAIGVIAGTCNGTIRNCIAQGAINGMQVLPPRIYDGFIGRPVYIGGLCGRVGTTNDATNANIEDCVAAVSIFNHASVAGAFVSRIPNVNYGKVTHCLALAPIFLYGQWADANGNLHKEQNQMLDDSDCLIDCHYPRGYRFSFKTTFNDEDIPQLNQHFQQSTRWQIEEEYYPMLKTFAATSIGKMLSLPFTPPENDYLLRMNAMTTFNPGNLNWTLYRPANDNIYFEVDPDMGVITPMRAASVDELLEYQHFLAVTSDDGNDVHIVGISPNMGSVEKGIAFVDENARYACYAFDRNHDHVITLAEVASVTNEETLNAFRNNRTIQHFPEFRYFKAVTALTSQLNGMTALQSISLPFALTAIHSNAFQGCTSLKEVTIPAKVDTVIQHPFYQSAVENIYVDKFNSRFKSRDGILLDNDNRLIAYPNGRNGAATLNGDISEIMPEALYRLNNCDTIFINAPNYYDVIYLHENGIATLDGNLPLVYVNDATYDQTLLDSYLDDESWEEFAEDNRIRRYYPLNISDAKAATLYIGFDIELPQSVIPYIVTTTDEEQGVAHLTRLTDSTETPTCKVPQLTPVILFADNQGLYKLFPSNDNPEPFPMWKNLLIGSNRDGLPVYQEDAERGNILTLGHNSSGTLGFFYYKGERVPPYRAMLTANDIADAKAFKIIIDDDNTTTTVEDKITTTQNPANSYYYTITGQRVTKQQLHKGIYIVNGKKILVK